jgi:calcium-dependent protein kinase
MGEVRQSFSVANILGKGPHDPKLDDVYRVEKQIGKGAFGVVRAGSKKSTGEPVAVKSISKAKLVCKEDVKDVQAEVAIMNLVAGHPYVVTLKVRFGVDMASHARQQSPVTYRSFVLPTSEHA